MKKINYIILVIIGAILIISGIYIYTNNFTRTNNETSKETNITDKNISKALTILENLNTDASFKFLKRLSKNEYKFLDKKNSTANEKIYYIINIETETYEIETEARREIS